MNKCVWNIKLMDILVVIDDEDEENLNCGDLDHGVKGFEVVETHLLTNTWGDKMSFVIVDVAIRMSFKAVHPLVVKYMHVRVRKD